MPYADREKRLEFYRSYHRKLRSEIKEAVRAAKDRPCADCGGSWPPCVMDFHHVNGDKEFNIAAAQASSGPNRLAKVLAEIEKCMLLCANCHRLRHADDD